MSFIGFAKIVAKTVPTVKKMGIKQGFKHMRKESIKEIGVVPAVAGLTSYPIGAIIGGAIPGSGTITALGIALLTNGIMKSPKYVKKALTTTGNSLKKCSIFLMK